MAADMRYFAASDQAAYEYPGADQGPLRDAFCRGAASVASPPPTAMRDALVTARSYLDSMLKYGDEYIIPPENLKAAISQIDAALSDASVTEGWRLVEVDKLKALRVHSAEASGAEGVGNLIKAKNEWRAFDAILDAMLAASPTKGVT